jgi:hypothetical protein
MNPVSKIETANRHVKPLQEKSLFFQPKLTINTPGDEYEREADAMAENVMRMEVNDKPFFSSRPLAISQLQRKCAHCEEEEKLNRKENDDDEGIIQNKPASDLFVQRKNSAPDQKPAGPAVYQTLESPGHALDKETKSLMEKRFGYDFTNVKIHNDADSHQSSSGIHALAYTHGDHIVFGAGQYQPQTNSGKKLLAHELTHVIQQANGKNSSIQKATPPDKTPAAPLIFDVLGSDYPVNKNFAQAAALEPGVDIHITSLNDLVGQLNQQVGTGTHRCVREINFWNHGSPRVQSLAGTEEIVRKDGSHYKLPTQELSLDWLLNENNLKVVENLRNLFCCGGIMRWLGCGTAGVQAEGGLRGSNEPKNPGGQDYDMRYFHYGNRYQSVDDALQHGAKLDGAQFGFLNAQSWADAMCLDVLANNDFTYMGAGVPDHHYKPGFGGQFLPFHPKSKGCSCDVETGRITGNWTLKEGKEYLQTETAKLLGPDHLWHLYLHTFRMLQRNPAQNLLQLKDTLKMLLDFVLPKLNIPGTLPQGPFEPWVYGNAKGNKWAGGTLPQLVFCFPNNFWKWIAFNQLIIKTTPEYTIQAIDHELIHATDIWSAAQTFQKNNSSPPVNPNPSSCDPQIPIDNWDKPFGDYVKSFIQFYNGTVSPERHVEIYGESAKDHLKNLTFQEILDWFSAMLTELPPNLPTGKHLLAEDEIESYFLNPATGQEVLRERIADQLTGTAKYYIFEQGKTEAETKLWRGRANTILKHFKQIWLTRRREQGLFIKMLKDEPI